MCIYVSAHVLNEVKCISYCDQKNAKAMYNLVNKCGWICLQEENHKD